ncbi:MAG: aspartyl protease family protein [Kiritimatiellia bacterium]
MHASAARHFLAITVFAAAFCFSGLPAGADTIHLTNGNTIEGIIAAETGDSITLRVPGGNATVPRSTIRVVTLDTAAENEALDKRWESRRILQSSYVPPGLEPLAAQFRTLRDLRRRAFEARESLFKSDDVLRANDEERNRLQAQYRAANTELQNTSAVTNQAAYNRLVAENNRLRAQLLLRQEDFETEQNARPARMKMISDYLAGLEQASNALASARRTQQGIAKTPAGTREFLERLSADQLTFSTDFQKFEIQSFRRGNATVAAVLINNRTWGNFILDTGAEVVALSRGFAKKAGLNLEEGRPTTLVMANGASVEGVTIRLASLKVGGLEQTGVLAAVLPEVPEKDIDGLLGMNVLQFFLIRPNAEGRLELEQFAPHAP